MSSKSAPEPAPWSLAARLTLWYAASSFVFIAASTGFLYWTLEHQLENEDDHFLAEKVQIVRLLLRDRTNGAVVLPHSDGLGAANRATASFYLRVQAPDGRVVLLTDGMD